MSAKEDIERVKREQAARERGYEEWNRQHWGKWYSATNVVSAEEAAAWNADRIAWEEGRPEREAGYAAQAAREAARRERRNARRRAARAAQKGNSGEGDR